MIDFFSGNYEFLSNFYICNIYYKGHKYISVEHAFQAAKVKDENNRLFIASASTPGLAKRRGRTVRIREDWEFIKDQVMYDLVLNKFKNNSDLKEQLLATGSEELVEGNFWGDSYWGVDKVRGGQNKLGKILMRVRKELQNVI